MPFVMYFFVVLGIKANIIANTDETVMTLGYFKFYFLNENS